ncbi:hypothetical protein NQK81_34925 [Amycolatopsis roodepoortensis]|uniref:TadE-like protein n=1 Tax=Amycolatopsis roodepoortensis TaxID=700274 RepID=A0ABR9L3X6_9PSEU|nr:hypothetical protein [Amycolatopsis roodepoortensis]MBE1575429.1 hypothetical protein [Amycolatopsis roodepoortensis]UUV29918.1 hypothetical protein NQK81_34925 [Amycolatopsis roodepoortensis]
MNLRRRTAELTGERGDENVSAILGLGALLLVTWLVLQVIVLFLGRNVALEAARDGVNAERLPPVDLAAAEHHAQNYVSRVTGSWLSNVNADASSDGRNVTVIVSAEAASLIPFARFSVSQRASGPIEQLTP